jgi:hypothetical protein
MTKGCSKCGGKTIWDTGEMRLEEEELKVEKERLKDVSCRELVEIYGQAHKHGPVTSEAARQLLVERGHRDTVFGVYLGRRM